MKKRIILAVLGLFILVVSGLTAYFYLEIGETPDYSNGMFVDRGEPDGYAAMYDLFTCL